MRGPCAQTVPDLTARPAPLVPWSQTAAVFGAPGDKRRRTCRQIGNLRGRAQRELAADHPIKAVYNRRMNTILQSTRRGKLDAELAKVMKKLAKDKMLRAISDHSYASTRYEQEMTQEALLAEAKRRMAL